MPKPLSEDMQKMQKDAEQRMRDMHQRSKTLNSGENMPPVPNFIQLRQTKAENYKEPMEEHPVSSKNVSTKSSSILSKLKGMDILKIFNFKNIHIDNDIILIVVLILLLSSEDTDELLLMALVYIML